MSISVKPVAKIDSITPTIREDSLYVRMRKTILFFSIFESKFTDYAGQFLPIGFSLSQEKEDKVEEEYDRTIDEGIRSTCESKCTSNEIECLREEGEEQEPDTYRKEHQEMKRIESLSARYIKSYEQNDNPRYNKENL